MLLGDTVVQRMQDEQCTSALTCRMETTPRQMRVRIEPWVRAAVHVSAMAHTDPPPSPLPVGAPDAKQDPAMDAYLASLNLSHIDVDAEMLMADAKADGLWVITGCAAWLGILVFDLWLPTTLFYQLNPLAEAAYFAGWLFLALLGALLWRGVWTLIRAWPFGDELRALGRKQRHLRMPSGPTTQGGTARLLGAGIVALGAVLVLLLPRDVQWQGQGYTGAWFVASLAAIATGILVGRFIIAHASIERPDRGPLPPIEWPSWMPWATGCAIVAAGGVILIIHSLTTQGDSSQEFTLAGASLALGICAAIWLAKRFDALETKWQNEAQMRQEEHERQD